MSKKALMIGIGSTIAVGGITTAIAVPLSQSQSETINKIPSTPLTQATTIQTLLNEIKQEDVVVLGKKQPSELVRKNLTETEQTSTVIQRNTVYAFDLENAQFALSEADNNKFKTFSDVSFSFEIKNEANNSVELNQGNINVTLKASVKDKEVGKVDLKLTSFKTISANLADVLKNNKETHKVVLDLVNTQKAKTLRTVEDLNKKTVAASAGVGERRSRAVLPSSSNEGISGLSTLLHEVTKDNEGEKDLKDWVVEGSVKLERISSNETTTLFHLVSAKEGTKLKLVKPGKDGAKEEALVDEVVVTNLLASGIKLVPNNVEEKHQVAYKTKFDQMAMQKGYMGDMAKGFHLEVKMMSGSDPALNVAINPINIDRKEEKQALLVNLEVSFGSGETLKTYKTNEATELDELKKAGFDLAIYSKNLMDDMEVVMANKIFDQNTDPNKLVSYFIKNGLTTPVKNSSIEMTQDVDHAMTKVPAGGFSLVNTSNAKYENGFNIGMVTKTMMNSGGGKHSSDTGNVDWVNENWISFVGYSFKGLGTKEMPETLIIPTINLFHIQEPAAAAPGGVLPGK